jgi:hypothetical protein
VTPPHSRQDRAADAASYAGRLQADLVSLSGMLNHYRSPSARLEELRETSDRSARQLDAISRRLDALGRRADPGKYTLSDQEHAVLDAARDVRARMMDTLAGLQQAERTVHKPRT